MNSYLYTWNPKRWRWVDQSDAIYRVNNGKPYDIHWSCGNTKKIVTGDVFFLMKLGVEPKGIIGCGYVSSTPYLLPHWDKEKAIQGKMALRTDLLFKALSEEPIISLSVLQDKFPSFKWTPEAGGLTVPDSIASEIFTEIQGSQCFGFAPESPSSIIKYAEGKSKTVTAKTYDRSPHARQACLEYYGYSCEICNFNFESAYGDIGRGYIEVHHLRQLADIGKEYLIDPVEDLRPVCANCHRMLHKRRPPFAIEDLKVKHSNS